MDRLDRIIHDRLAETVPDVIGILSVEMRRRFGDSVTAVVFYGSCLRKSDPLDGVVDLYVIVSSYREAYPTRKSALLAAMLPPTVGYLELDSPAGQVRAKYAVISMRDFRRGTCGDWFHSYLWGRFAQPCALAFARTRSDERVVVECVAGACRTLLSRTLALNPMPVGVKDLWVNALELSYGTELRPESTGRARELVESNLGYYADIATALAPELGMEVVGNEEGRPVFSMVFPPWRVAAAGFAWRVRRFSGKMLSPARWLKALATFEGGLDYAVWKLERHSGTRVEVPDRVRRRPWLYIWPELWRLYRQGVLR